MKKIAWLFLHRCGRKSLFLFFVLPQNKIEPKGVDASKLIEL